MDMYAGAKNHGGGSRASPSSAFLRSQASRDLDGGRSWHQLGSADWRSTSVSSEVLNETLQKVKTAPGSDWREVEAARRVEDTFGVLREMKLKQREDRHSNMHRLIQKRDKGLQSSYDKLLHQDAYTARHREVREHMMPPQEPRVSPEAAVRAKANRIKVMDQQESHRRGFFVAHAAKAKEVERSIDEQKNMQAMKYALVNAEDRTRWRHNHAAVVDRHKDERQGVLDNFARRQAQLDAAGKKAEECGAIRRELLQLRDTHRRLFDFRKERKKVYEAQVRQNTVSELAERRTEETRRMRPSPVAPASPTVAPGALGPGLLALEEDPKEQYSPAEQQWMTSVWRNSSQRPTARGLTSSASSPALRG